MTSSLIVILSSVAVFATTVGVFYYSGAFVPPKIQKTRALLIGIDGFLTRCYDQAQTDGYEYLKAQGSYTFKARTAIEEVSGPGWSNILCALDTEDTGITSNDWKAPWLYGKPQSITPITGNNQPLPCGFQQFKNNNLTLRTSAFYSWDWFVNLGNVSIPGSLDREIFCNGDEMDTSIVCDQQAIDNALQIIRQQDWDFFFLYFGSLDETGHATNFCSQQYINRISAVNGYIKQVVQELQEQGLWDSTYVILTSDHGAGYLTPSHGAVIDDENLLVPWILTGPNVKQGYEIQSEVKNADTMPTFFYAMGLQSNPLWRAVPVYEAFSNSTSTKVKKILAY